MNTKQLLILILSLVGLTVLVIVGFMLIYSTNPSFLGMAPQNGKDESKNPKTAMPPLKDSPYFLISETDFTDILRSKLIAENALANSKAMLDNHNHIVDSLARIIRSKDSLNASLLTLRDSLNVYQNYLNSAYKTNETLQDSLAKIYLENPSLANSIQNLAQDKPQDSLMMENIRQFANIYKNSDPVKVAKIIQKMDNRTAAEILKLMPTKQAGKIIDELPEDKAMSILLLK